MSDTPQVINGNKYGWSSTEIGLDGIDQPAITECTYGPSQEPGKVRARGHRVLALVRGEADGEGSFSMLKAEASAFIKRLGPGFMTGKKDFPITISYDEDGEGGIVTDKLYGCRITKVEDSPKVGTEAVMTKFDFHIMRMELNGVDPHAV